MEAFTSYFLPRNFPKLLALAGDSTITKVLATLLTSNYDNGYRTKESNDTLRKIYPPKNL
jgi:hypothetical protein